MHYNHHKEVPFRLLKPVDKLSVLPHPSPGGRGDEGAGNLLIQGDNLEALKALLPYYAGQVKCIYIDPPYNTGNEGWVYNDNVNSPEMKAWLGKVVGGEAEDLSRHDKWLCMMYPRLALLREMLRNDGSLWMSIDDNEVHSARALLDEVFGRGNFVATIVWQKKYSAANDSTGIPPMHDYILVYAKSGIFDRKLLPRTEKQDKAYRNPDNDPRGPWKAVDYTSNKTRQERPNLYYSLKHPLTGNEVLPKESRVWGFAKDLYDEHVKDKRIWWGQNNQNAVPALKRFLSEVQGGIVPVTWWPHEDGGHTDEAKKEVLEILETLPGYMTPKPTRLIRRILQITTSDNDIVLDAFAGSATTGHAVVQINNEDGGNRRFILVELDKNIAQNIASERMKRVIEGYTYNDSKSNKKKEKGLGGGFRYCELGATLFDANGQIREEVKYNDLAQHVYFIETGQPLPLTPSPSTLSGTRPKGRGGRGAKSGFPLLGIHNDTAVYLLYNGVLKDKKPNGGNVLTRAILKSLPKHEGTKIIYGTGCLLSEEKLRELGITFRQIPYEVKAN